MSSSGFASRAQSAGDRNTNASNQANTGGNTQQSDRNAGTGGQKK